MTHRHSAPVLRGRLETALDAVCDAEQAYTKAIRRLPRRADQRWIATRGVSGPNAQGIDALNAEDDLLKAHMRANTYAAALAATLLIDMDTTEVPA